MEFSRIGNRLEHDPIVFRSDHDSELCMVSGEIAAYRFGIEVTVIAGMEHGHDYTLVADE